MSGGRCRRRVASRGRTSSIRPRRRPTSRGRRPSSTGPSARRRRRRGPVDDALARRRRGRARRRRAPPPRARAAPSSTRSPGAAGACGACRRCRRGRSRVVAPEHGVDRVARRAGDLGHDHPLAAEERVHERATCRRSAGRGSRPGSPRRQSGGSRAPAADSRRSRPAGRRCRGRGARRRDRVAEPEAVELERERLLAGSSILFATTSTGLPRHAQDLGELLVAGRHAGARVDDEEDEVGLLDRRARLLRDRARRSASVAMSTPPVSMSRNACPSTRRRAPCGRA